MSWASTRQNINILHYTYSFCLPICLTVISKACVRVAKVSKKKEKCKKRTSHEKVHEENKKKQTKIEVKKKSFMARFLFYQNEIECSTCVNITFSFDEVLTHTA
jgi:hypothetical protein